MRKVELEDIIHQMHLRVFLDPCHTNLDWVDGYADLENINSPCMKVETDNWPSANRDARSLVGGLVSFEPDYDYYELED